MLKDPSRLSNRPARAIYLVPKTASKDAEEVIRVSSYFWDSISSDNVIVWENLLFPSVSS